MGITNAAGWDTMDDMKSKMVDPDLEFPGRRLFEALLGPGKVLASTLVQDDDSEGSSVVAKPKTPLEPFTAAVEVCDANHIEV